MNKLKNNILILLACSPLLLGIALLPGNVKAGSYGGMYFTQLYQNRYGEVTRVSGTKITISPTKDNNWKWKTSGGTCYGCRTCWLSGGIKAAGFDCNGTSWGSWNEYWTDGNGVINLDNTMACGTSKCTTSPDNGQCSPFRLNVEIPGNYPAGSWYYSWDGANWSGLYSYNTRSAPFEIGFANGSLTYFYVKYVEEVRNLTIGIETDTDRNGTYIGDGGAIGGRVTATGIDCAGDCSETYNLEATVNVTATANNGYTFKGWKFWQTNDGIPHNVEADATDSTTVKDPGGAVLHTLNPHGVYMDRNWSVSAYFEKERAIALTCSVTPQTGLAPLVVRVEAIDGTPPFTYSMGEGTPSTRNNRVVYYTYSTGGSKTISVTDSTSPVGRCDVNITVSDPQSGTGGEVAP